MMNNKILYFINFLALFILSSQSIATNNDYFKHQVAKFYHLKTIKNLYLLNIHGYQQSKDYTCAPAMVMNLLHYYHKLSDAQMSAATEDQIAKEMGSSPDNGTSPQQVVNWLKAHDFNATLGINGQVSMLKENLKKGIPILVEWIDWGGHWELVTGYQAVGKTFDDDKDTLIFADSAAHFNNVNALDGLTVINPDRFNSMWFDAQYFNPGHLVKGIYIVAVPK